MPNADEHVNKKAIRATFESEMPIKTIFNASHCVAWLIGPFRLPQLLHPFQLAIEMLLHTLRVTKTAE